VVREMIVAETKEERLRALEKIAPFQKQDFKAIFKSMNGLPVTIRLLDPPLHEFLPLSDKDKDLFAKQMNMSVSDINARIKKLSETNPMIGHRGSRLAITFPEIYEMQVRCIFEAAQEIGLEYGLVIKPEIMAPFIFGTAEVRYLKDLVASVHDDIHSDIEYSFGVMIELPRAALQAGEIAKLVDFCSFGTNDLTQTAMGISRDDAGKFLSAYRGHNIIESDPFVSIDQIGVGELVKIAVERIRAANPKVKIGICGEHGGDPESIRFFCGLSMDYVSCSPYRIPIARLTVAQMLFKARSS
jgi:pyruvate,orthophosphate dikinase